MSEADKRGAGRPSIFSDEFADRICDELMDGAVFAKRRG